MSMSGRFLRLWAVMALALLAGCANMNLHPSSQRTLLEEYKQVSGWTAAQTELAVGERERLYAASPAGINRMRLALALGFGKGKAVDVKRALRLFDGITKNPNDHTPEQLLFAEMLAGVLKDQGQAEVLIGSAEAKLSTAESKLSTAEAKLSTAETKVSTVSKQLENERSRADALAKKLEALMSIEKSLQKR